ncbi:MAG: terpene cyclase/mutase family protein [Planctomycetes bacterium]|nr:terpene cyclase/mutase family protein [Planctomycetota bacterium]
MLTALLLAPVLLLQGPSEKQVFDSYLNSIKTAQMSDGSYGGNVVVTADVLTGMALSPRAYRVDDGPFMRDAVEYLLKHQAERTDDWGRDLRIGMALVHVHRDRYLPTAKAIAARHQHSLDDFKSLSITTGTPYGLMEIPQDANLHQIARALADAGIARTYKVKAATATDQDHAAVIAKRRASYERGVDYLLRTRGKSGFWEMMGHPEPGISALAARALLGSERESARKVGMGVVDWLLTMQQEDGSIHGGRVAVYTTSVAIGALVDAGREKDKEAIKRALNFLRMTQTDADEGYSEEDKFYGGIGYGGDLRPDLSNLQFALQALKDAGTDENDDAFQRAVHFLNRSQNLKETNTETFYDQDDPTPIAAGNDGGAVYYPGNSMAGTTTMPDGTVIARSYGSMTYALLKCFTFAGIPPEDPRVAAAIEWISSHWTLEVNPGFDPMKDPRGGFQGLFYYYLSLSQALTAAKVDKIVTVGGVEHDWRTELADKLMSLQAEDGHWINNDAERWYEGNPALCTAYALGAMRELLK